MITAIGPAQFFRSRTGDRRPDAGIVGIGLGGDIVMDRVVNFGRDPFGVNALQGSGLERAGQVNRSATTMQRRSALMSNTPAADSTGSPLMQAEGL